MNKIKGVNNYVKDVSKSKTLDNNKLKNNEQNKKQNKENKKDKNNSFDDIFIKHLNKNE